LLNLLYYFASIDIISLNPTRTYPTQFPGVTWDNDNWQLIGETLDQGHYQSRLSIANGYVGINVASAGPFFELDTPVDGDIVNGWPLFSRRQTFATVAGFFSEHDEKSVISGVPHWSGLVLDLGDDNYLDATVDKMTLSDYKTTYNFKQGTVSWCYTWTPKKNKGSFNISYRLFAHKLYINQAIVRMDIKSSMDIKATIVNILDGYTAVRTDFAESGQDGNAIYSAVKPKGVGNVTAYIYTVLDSPIINQSISAIVKDKPYIHPNDSSIAQAVDVEFCAGETVTIMKYVGIASSDAFQDPRATAKDAANKAKMMGFDALWARHVQEWETLLPPWLVDDFASPDNGILPEDPLIVESAIAAVTNPYYLLQNTVGKNAILEIAGAPVDEWSISVGGLTSDSYAGLIFWDADLWMHPGLAASHPESAQQIINYRLAKYRQARLNIGTAHMSSQNKTYFSDSAAIFPWTSGRHGNCTKIGWCWDYEYHLNGDIGLSLINQWIANGDTNTFQELYFPIYDSIATMYSNLLIKNGTYWTLTNMTDPVRIYPIFFIPG
jgi:trehalose/maltose hydrolase-like predicted phosphorylase